QGGAGRVGGKERHLRRSGRRSRRRGHDRVGGRRRASREVRRRLRDRASRPPPNDTRAQPRDAGAALSADLSTHAPKPMSVKPIVKYGDPVLPSPAAPVPAIDDAVVRLVDDMVATMYAAPGI